MRLAVIFFYPLMFFNLKNLHRVLFRRNFANEISSHTYQIFFFLIGYYCYLICNIRDI